MFIIDTGDSFPSNKMMTWFFLVSVCLFACRSVLVCVYVNICWGLRLFVQYVSHWKFKARAWETLVSVHCFIENEKQIIPKTMLFIVRSFFPTFCYFGIETCDFSKYKERTFIFLLQSTLLS